MMSFDFSYVFTIYAFTEFWQVLWVDCFMCNKVHLIKYLEYLHFVIKLLLIKVIYLCKKGGFFFCPTVELLVLSSSELKAQVSFSEELSSVCPSSVCLSVNFTHFQLLLQMNHSAILNRNWHKASFGYGNLNLFTWWAMLFSKRR